MWIQFSLFDRTYNNAIPENNAWNRFWDAANPLPELLGTGNADNDANPLVTDPDWQAPAFFLKQAGLSMQADGTILIPATRQGAELLAVMNHGTTGFGIGHYGQLNVEQLFKDLPIIPEVQNAYRDTSRNILGAQAYAAVQTIVSGLVAANLARSTPTVIVNPSTGQRLSVTSNPRTGGITGTLSDRNGIPLATQSTLGRDFNRTINVPPNITPNRTNVSPGGLTTRPSQPGQVSQPVAVTTNQQIVLGNTPVTIRSDVTNGVPTFTAVYGANGQYVKPLPGATTPSEAIQNFRASYNAGSLPGLQPAQPNRITDITAKPYAATQSNYNTLITQAINFNNASNGNVSLAIPVVRTPGGQVSIDYFENLSPAAARSLIWNLERKDLLAPNFSSDAVFKQNGIGGGGRLENGRVNDPENNLQFREANIYFRSLTQKDIDKAVANAALTVNGKTGETVDPRYTGQLVQRAVGENRPERGNVSLVIPRVIEIPYTNGRGEVVTSLPVSFTEYFSNLSPSEANSALSAAGGWLDPNRDGKREYYPGSDTIRISDPAVPRDINPSNYWDKLLNISGLSQQGLAERNQRIANPPQPASATPVSQPQQTNPETAPQTRPNPPAITAPNPSQPPAPTQTGGSVGAMSANERPKPSLTQQEADSAIDLTSRFRSLEEARSYAETQPETQIFSYTDLTDQAAGEVFFLRGGGENAPTQFIAQSSMFHPDAIAFNRAINNWSDIVSTGLGSTNPQDRSLTSILKQIEPQANALARDQFPNLPSIRMDYGRERLEGARNTVLNHQIFQEFIPPTLELMRRDWDNVSLVGGGKPSFPPEELMSRLQAGDQEALRLVYPWKINTGNGEVLTAFVSIDPPNPSLLNNPFPFTMTTYYPSNANTISAIKTELSEKWTQMQAIPAGDPRAVDAIADFMFDYNKLYWHSHGDGEIGLSLMSGYLETKGFRLERINPSIDVNGVSFQTTREEYIENFRNGSYFDLTPRPGVVQSSANTPVEPALSNVNPPSVPQDPIGLANYVNTLNPADLAGVIASPRAEEFRIVLRHATEIAGVPYRSNTGITQEQHAALSNNLTSLRDAWSALSPRATMSDIAGDRDLPRTVTASEARDILIADGIDADLADDFIQQSNGLISYWPNDQIRGLPADFYSAGRAPAGNPADQDLTAFDNALTGPLYPIPSGGWLVAPRLPANTQMFVHGDIHGASNLYLAMQSTAERLVSEGRQQTQGNGENIRTVIASIGDLGNKGPDTAAVAEDLLAKISRYSNDPNTDFMIFSGNHEDPRTYGTLLDVNADVSNAEVRNAMEDILKKGGYLTLESFERRVVGRGEPGFSVDLSKPPTPSDPESIPYYRQLQQDIARIVPEEYREMALNLPLATTIGDYFLSHGGGDPKKSRFTIDQSVSLTQLSPDQDFRWTRLPNVVEGHEGEIFLDLREPVYPIFGHTMNVRPGETPFGFDLDVSAFRAWQMAGLYIPPNGQGQAQLVLVRQTDGADRDVEVRVIPIETAIQEGLIDTRFDPVNLVPNREEKSDREMIKRYMDSIQP
ncbi:MAG: hypothetical protein SGJ17_09805 [Hyphomicrobiales bacterium]|nr:hypothetical protein [Hyphomicrobiales bacterium]